MSRNDFWAQTPAGHIREADESWLRTLMMRKDGRKIRRGCVQINSLLYYAEPLISYEGLELQVWWDPGDIRAVRIFRDGVEICEAALQEPAMLGDIQALKDHTARRRQLREKRLQMKAAVEVLRGGVPPETAQDAIAALQEQANRAPIPFTPAPRRLERLEPMSAAEALDIIEAETREVAQGLGARDDGLGPEEPLLLPALPAQSETADGDGDILEIYGMKLQV
jgi:hypothetical protein